MLNKRKLSNSFKKLSWLIVVQTVKLSWGNMSGFLCCVSLQVRIQKLSKNHHFPFHFIAFTFFFFGKHLFTIKVFAVHFRDMSRSRWVSNFEPNGTQMCFCSTVKFHRVIQRRRATLCKQQHAHMWNQSSYLFLLIITYLKPQADVHILISSLSSQTSTQPTWRIDGVKRSFSMWTNSRSHFSILSFIIFKSFC